MKELVLATHNKNKAKEFQSLLADLGVRVMTLDAFPTIGKIEENADTLEGNAMLKADAVRQATGLASLADDTGLEVHYLGGAPGVYSSRYGGANSSYAENVAKLLKDLRGVPPRRRAARFRCVLALLTPGAEAKIAEGICPGVIIEEPLGENGFGYDPVFIPYGHHQTFAQMDDSVKNMISHRGRAIVDMLPILRECFKLS